MENLIEMQRQQETHRLDQERKCSVVLHRKHLVHLHVNLEIERVVIGYWFELEAIMKRHPKLQTRFREKTIVDIQLRAFSVLTS